MTNNETGEGRPGCAEIEFGTLFRVRLFGEMTDRVDVVIDIGQDKWFFSGQIFKIEGESAFGMAGTGSPENFGEVVGKMSLEELITAAKKKALEY